MCVNMLVRLSTDLTNDEVGVLQDDLRCAAEPPFSVEASYLFICIADTASSMLI